MKGYLPVAVSALQPETMIQFMINLNFVFFSQDLLITSYGASDTKGVIDFLGVRKRDRVCVISYIHLSGLLC